MLSPYPSPSSFSLLALFLPGIWFLAYRLSIRALNQNVACYAVPGAFICIWLTGVHWLGVLSHSFYIGLCLGTIGPGLAGYVLQVTRPRSLTNSLPRPDRTTLLALVLCVLLYWPAVVNYDFHDKLDHVLGHFAITEQILNGVYPPRDIYDASHVLRYHFGTNTLFASVSAVFRVATDVSMDSVTLLLWAYYLLIASVFSVRLFSSDHRYQWISVYVCAFAGGFPWIVADGFDWQQALTSLYLLPGPDGSEWAHGNVIWVLPPLPSWFLSHPWTLSLPLLCLCMLLSLERHEGDRPLQSLLLLLCLSVLFISSLPTALALSASIVGALTIDLIRTRARKEDLLLIVAIIILSSVSLALSPMVGLLSGSTEATANGALRLTPSGVAGTWYHTILWNLAAVGALLPLGLMGLKGNKLRSIFILIIGGSLLLPNVVNYRFTFDMWKFTFIGTVSLSLLVAATVTREATAGKRLSSILKSALVSLQGFAFLLAFWSYSSLPFPFTPTIRSVHTQLGLTPEHWKIIHYLKASANPGELVCVPPGTLSLAYAALGGLPQCVLDNNFLAVGNTRLAYERRMAILRGTPPSAEELRTEGIVWIVIDKARPMAFGDSISELEKNGTVEPVLEAQHVTLYKVKTRTKG